MKSLVLAFMLPLSALALACSSSSSPPAGAGTSAPSSDDAGGAAAVDAGADDSATPHVDAAMPLDLDAGGGSSYLRFANLSPDAPALDLCVSANDSQAWVGPLAGTAQGIAYAQASVYFALPPAYSYGARVVAAGSKSCDVSITGNENNLPNLLSGQHMTIAVEGDLAVVGTDESFGLDVYLDDDAVSESGVALRFVNASASAAPIDFGEGSLAASSFAPLFTGTGLTAAGSADTIDAGPIDVNGYVTIPNPSSAVMSAHVSGSSSDLVTASGVSSKNGAVLTMFLIGGKTNDAAHPSQLLLCDEDAAPASGLASCKVASQ